MASIPSRLGLLLVAFMLLLLAGPPASQARSGLAGIVRKPIDRTQQTALGFGDRSHWLQPWRADSDRPPATKLPDAIGINLDNHVRSHEVDGLARLLRESGVRRARYEIGWDAISYDDPSRLRDPAPVHRSVTALRANGIRPLILLNANHGIPGPLREVQLRLIAPAAAGARQAEWNLEPAATQLRPSEIAHTRAKAVLRFLTAYATRAPRR